MLSIETLYALGLCVGISAVLLFKTPAGEGGGGLPITFIALSPVIRSIFYFWFARETTFLSFARDRVLGSRCARSLDATLRRTLLAPVIDVPIPDVGVLRVRFFSDVISTWMRLRLKGRALDRAPWLQLQGAPSFWLPTRAVGAKRLTLPDPSRRWRYWRLPWKQADPTVEDANFCAALPATKESLVLTSRPGHVLIRASCGSDASVDFGNNVDFENAVRLAIAWVAAVQQTNGARAHAGLPDSQRDAPTEAASRAPGSAGSCVGQSTR